MRRYKVESLVQTRYQTSKFHVYGGRRPRRREQAERLDSPAVMALGASGPDHDETMMHCICLVMALSVILGLAFYIWHTDSVHKMQSTKLLKIVRAARLAIHGAKGNCLGGYKGALKHVRADRAESRAIQHAKNATPNATHRDALLAVARTHKLFIVAGLGTTGTSALERSLNRLGLRTAKWGHIVQQPSGKSMASPIMDSLLQRSPKFFALFNEVCMRTRDTHCGTKR